MANQKRDNGIVYSTNPGFFSKSEEEEGVNKITPAQQELRIWLEKNHRGGKIASVIKGYRGSEEDLKDLAKLLKTSLGTGGSVKDGEILIQGDFREKLLTILTAKGYKTKKAGG